MSKELITIQYNMNPWQLGMSFEAHAYLKAKKNLSRSQFSLIAGMNNNVLGNEPNAYWLRKYSHNLRTIRILNQQLLNNDFVDETILARNKSKQIRSRFEKFDFTSILNSSKDEFGIEISSAETAVKLALVDRLKLWNIDSVEDLDISRDYLLAYISTFVFAKELFLNGCFEYLNIFNSRFLNERATKDAAIFAGIQVIEFEQINSRADSFGIFETTVHDPYARAEMARSQFKERKESNPGYEDFTSEWIGKRRSGELQNFTKRQAKGKLPEIYKDRKLLSCFLSSFDELILAGYVTEGSNLNQNNALKSLGEEIAKHSDWQLVIRCHPNMLTRPKSEQDYWRKLLKDIDALVIFPHEDIDTYSLVERSDLVLTFGSTVAVEALALNVPSLVIGQSLYHGHNLVRIVSNLPELQKYLDDLPRIDEEQLSELEVYSYFQLYGGIRFQHLSVEKAEVYKFNPSLHWNKSRALGSEKFLSLISRAYSRIQDSKKLKTLWMSKGLFKKG